MYSAKRVILMRHTDAAGVMFFPRFPELAHDVYEEAMTGRGLPFGPMVREGSFILPIVRLEVDYRAPLWLGDEITVEVRVEDIAHRRYTIAYQFVKADGTVATRLRIVHAAVDINTRKSMPLPEQLVKALRGL